MKRRDWDNKTKCKIVMEGLNGVLLQAFATNMKSAKVCIIAGEIPLWKTHQLLLKSTPKLAGKNAWKKKIIA